MKKRQWFKIILGFIIAIFSAYGVDGDCRLDEDEVLIKGIFQIFEDKIKEKPNIESTEDMLYVSIAKQRLYHFNKQGSLVNEYIISSAKNGINCEENSFGTPKGLHKISDKIGDNQPLGMVFQSREPIGKYYWDCLPDEFCGITTRIMRLKGLEEGLNRGNCQHTEIVHSCDTFDRYIYLHGTRTEEKIGTPQSIGCILLKNDDIIKLFESIAIDSLVYIDEK